MMILIICLNIWLIIGVFTILYHLPHFPQTTVKFVLYCAIYGGPFLVICYGVIYLLVTFIDFFTHSSMKSKFKKLNDWLFDRI